MTALRPLLLFFLTTLGATAQERDKAFWRALLGADARRPTADEVVQLLPELSGMLGSRDSELRDDIAYTLLAQWLHKDADPPVPIAQQRQLLAQWTSAIGEAPRGGPDAVLRRSFSTLSLALLVALDNQDPWLERAEFDRILASAIDYLTVELDPRGLDAEVGWVHALAHTADLLKFCARSRHLSPADQGAILTAIGQRLTKSTTPWVFGEDERLARAVLSLVARDDFDERVFAEWLRTYGTPERNGWATIEGAMREHDRRHLFTTLHALLTVDPRDSASLQKGRALVAAHLKGA
ncbi:MAG: DUF2785 domain-containing protein [Planctomycetes bacterium]|nr:DUF2785 domain-containing protein [Planctomycetota bacterium]